MTLEQLRIFIAVAEHEHVTRGAEDLNLTQSAVSAAIAALESQHGMKLFERVGRRIRLTATGRAFIPEARAVLARASAAERVLEDHADLTRGSLTLSASQTLASYWLPPFMVKFRAAHPGIDLQLAVGNSEQVVSDIENLRADLGFVEGGAPADALLDLQLGEDEMYIVLAPGHPWTRHPPSPSELAQGPWVMRERGSGTRARMDAMLAELGAMPITPASVLELPSNEAIRAAVAAGGGATLLSRRERWSGLTAYRPAGASGYCVTPSGI